MKHQIKNKLRTNRGITLIALVITVIVLLILARNNYKCTHWREPEY